jgi:hypothetical protein
MEPIQLLAIIVVFVLLVLLAAVAVSRRRGERIERKIDALGQCMGIAMHFNHIDEEYGRRSSMVALFTASGTKEHEEHEHDKR